MSARYRRALAVYRETSREAHESVADVLPTIDAAIVRVIGRRDGATAHEIEHATGYKHQTVSAQIRHMSEAGLLVASGETRRNDTGRRCIVWRLPPRAGTQGQLFAEAAAWTT
jgi:DNA-binding MarR family transcriptional regulator